MVNIKKAQDCCGCTACKYICPNDAISMVEDKLGFKYPSVDKNKCIECGLCEKVCSFNEDYDKSLNLKSPEVVGARHINIDEVITSRSGGVFTAISDYIISQNGVVYGAAFAEVTYVKHKRATSTEDCVKFKGSKYVESDLNDTFQQVKKDLKAGKIVLFSGTPCQTSGLNSFIGTNLRKNLLLVDILCHGAPSPKVWADYVRYLEKKRKKKIIKANFRDKIACGWSAHKESFTTSDSRLIVRRTFSDLFYRHIMFRHSCSNCHFCNTQRPSDITLGDFWGWQKAGINVNYDDKGVSILLINTKKGLECLNALKKNLILYPTRLEDCMQPSLQKHLEIPKDRDTFEKMYVCRGFEFTAKHYQVLGFPYIMRRFKERSATAFNLIIKRIKK